MHYNTWPPIVADPARFVADAAKAGHAVRVLRPGESLEL
jgi:L-ascorbate metabolism protein UlaG (beta-lactamase superfamily)